MSISLRVHIAVFTLSKMNIPLIPHKIVKLKVQVSIEENKVVKLKFQAVKLNSTFKFDIYDNHRALTLCSLMCNHPYINCVE